MQNPLTSAISLCLALLLAAPAPMLAAPPQQPPAAPQQQDNGLKLVILEGEGAVNNVKQRTAREVIVEVRDENNRPVGGAVVMFALPDRGPSGLFANGQKIATVTTGADGKAQTIITELNGAKGQMPIRVSASNAGMRASTIITQTSVAAGGMSAAGVGIIVAIVAGAGAAAAVALSGGSSSPPASNPGEPPRPTATVTAGSPTVGPPQ